MTGKVNTGGGEGKGREGVVKGTKGMHMEKEQGSWQKWERGLRGAVLSREGWDGSCSGWDKRLAGKFL